MTGGRALRRIGDPVVAAAPAGVRIRTRIRPTAAEAEALSAIGELLGSVYRCELAGRVGLGRLDREAHALWRAQRKQALTAVSSSRWAGANRRACAHAWPDGLASNGVTTAEPAQFREAVAAMNATTVRPEIELGPIRPPQRLAPYSYALGAEVRHPDTAIVPERSEGDAFGRLILLHDPEGAEAWDGTMRLVAYIQADLDSSEAVDPLLPEVAWSWLVEALESRAEHVTALGGTVTATTSVRYGDISGPPRAHQLELRASWTATTLELGPHVQAFCEVLEHAAGLPPAGVTDLGSRTRA
jgi:Protein of unknown function (DUF3000)